MRVLVTGGTGQLGKSLKVFLPEAIFVSSKTYNLMNRYEVDNMLKNTKPEVVIHAAAKVGGILDNIKYPYSYYTENTLINTNVISACVDMEVPRFIGILSTCVYPDVSTHYPMSEDLIYTGAPSKTNFSYAMSKRGMAAQIDSVVKTLNHKYCYVIPSNLYGPYELLSEKSHFIGSIFSKILSARENLNNKITLLGSGKALRQVLYSKDLASILSEMVKNEIYENFNIANPDNLSIDAYAKKILEVLKLKDWEIVYDNSKSDGQLRKDVDISKFLNLFPGFKFTKFENGITEMATNYDFN
jgi:GDP-L-fucose synthase